MIPFETINMSKYQSAVEHPKTAFADPDLAEMKVFKNSLGWPASWSGNFAIVYRLAGRNRITSREEVVAVRCFKKLGPDLAHRYELICSTLDRAAPHSRFLLRTRYLAEGIKIDGAWKPVTTLPWVDGVPLDRYFDSAHTKLYEMERVRAQLRDIGRELESAGISHCDLQHRNILVDNTGTLRLIDYDGMFVPTLRGGRTNELGHPDYQHPGRDDGAIFGPGLDRFSLIVIYLQTYAIARHPELWAAKERTEGLLLRREDYIDPDASATIAALRSYDDLREIVDVFRRLSVGSIGDVPSLASFLRDLGLEDRAPIRAQIASPPDEPTPTRPPEVPVSPPSRPVAIAPSARPTRTPGTAAPTLYMTVTPTDATQLAANAGDVLMVVGRFDRATQRRAPGGGLATSLYLRVQGPGTFSILVEGATQQQFASLGKAWTVKPGAWLAVTGLLARGGSDYIVQVDQMAQLERIPELEARRRMNMRRFSAGKPGGSGDGGTGGTGGARERRAAQPVDRPVGPPTPGVVRHDRPVSALPRTRGGQLVAKDFRELGRLLGRNGQNTDGGDEK